MIDYNKINPDILSGIRQATHSFINLHLKDENISSSYIIFILILSKYSSLTQKEFSNIIGCNKAHTNRIITNLLQLEYLKKEEGYKNVKLSLTEKGITLSKKLDSIIQKWRETIFYNISSSELDSFFSTLDKMNSNLNNFINKEVK